ncbi:MAG: SMC-Scp complex subunit ScpB [Nitrospinota bacterium]|nr:SMC-Scp complex subunit ScpB [Nitrospinota bacterium]
MDPGEIKAIVENVLLAAGESVTLDRLAETFQKGVPRKDVRQALKDLEEDYAEKNLKIQEVADGYQLCTRVEYADWIKKYLRLDKATRLSQPALDTLSIIAYKQPITRAEVESIRGVDSSGVIKTLLEKNIVGPAGRRKVIGRPMMYKTTRKFLEYFGLKDLSDMPTLEDFKEGEISEDGPDSSRQTKLLFSELYSGETRAGEDIAQAETPFDSTGDESENT